MVRMETFRLQEVLLWTTVRIKNLPWRQQLVTKYLPYWPLFLLFAVLASAAAFVYLRYYTTPIYQASAVLIIKDEKKGNEDSKLTESLDMISSKKIVENEGNYSKKDPSIINVKKLKAVDLGVKYEKYSHKFNEELNEFVNLKANIESKMKLLI